MQPDRNTNLKIGILGKSGPGFQNMVSKAFIYLLIYLFTAKPCLH